MWAFEENDRRWGLRASAAAWGKSRHPQRVAKSAYVFRSMTIPTSMRYHDGETFHTNVEVSAAAGEIEQCGVALRKVARSRHCSPHSGRRHGFRPFRFNSGDVHIWRGKPKVRSLVKQSTRVANCLRRLTPPHDLPSTTNHQRGSVFQRLESHQCFRVARTRPTRPHAPSGPPHSIFALRQFTQHCSSWS